jgi:hypothetical protein
MTTAQKQRLRDAAAILGVKRLDDVADMEVTSHTFDPDGVSTVEGYIQIPVRLTATRNPASTYGLDVELDIL